MLADNVNTANVNGLRLIYPFSAFKPTSVFIKPIYSIGGNGLSLDESRENNKTIAETARILKSGGRFICTARNNAFKRQYRILEPFGFKKDETVEILKKCRLYSDTERLVACCEQNGLHFENKDEFEIEGKYTAVVTAFTKK